VSLPSYVIYDPAERERFRLTGAMDVESFSGAVEAVRLRASAFVRSAELHDRHQDVEGAMLAGNTYGQMGLMNDARNAYQEAGKIAARKGDPATRQLAEALSAFTYVREGDVARAVRFLERLAAAPVNRESEALLSLTLGNAYRAGGNESAALGSYQHAQSAAAPESTVYAEAGAAIADMQRAPR
jgi:tetratricopeptide (TPR) repeat protein